MSHLNMEMIGYIASWLATVASFGFSLACAHKFTRHSWGYFTIFSLFALEWALLFAFYTNAEQNYVTAIYGAFLLVLIGTLIRAQDTDQRPPVELRRFEFIALLVFSAGLAGTVKGISTPDLPQAKSIELLSAKDCSLVFGIALDCAGFYSIYSGLGGGLARNGWLRFLTYAYAAVELVLLAVSFVTPALVTPMHWSFKLPLALLKVGYTLVVCIQLLDRFVPAPFPARGFWDKVGVVLGLYP
jgi:hypothetical protein